MNPAIQTNNLTYTYSPGSPFSKTALDNINLTIQPGEFVGIIGHTGSGKSTLIQHFNRLLKPTAGKVLIDGMDLSEKEVDIKKIRQKVGLVFQYPEYQLFEETVFEDIAFGPKNLNYSEEEVQQLVRESMSFVGLSEDLYQKSPFELSGGQKRRVAIAGVLAMKPDILILDEPTAGLDRRAKDLILNKISELHCQMGTTILIVSHSMEDIASYAQRVIVMNGGKVAFDAAPYDVFQNEQELTRIGLDIPHISKIINFLHEKGYPVDTHACTVDAVKQELLKLIGGAPC